jgi:hypothetical protein
MGELVSYSAQALSGIPTGPYQLKSRTDWPNWYIQLTWHAKLRNVWELVNPDAPNAPGMHDGAPQLPTISSTSDERPPARSTRSQSAQLSEFDASGGLSSLEIYNQELAMYKVKSSEWAAKAERLQKLWNWVNATVSPAILSPVMVKLVTNNVTTLQALVRALKEELAPTDVSTQNQVRAEYRQHLGAAKQGRAAPQDWYQRWSYLYMRAKSYELAEVDGALAVQDFLDALGHRIAPEWARTMNQRIIQDSILGLETLNLDQVSRVFGGLMHEHTIRSGKDNPGVFATFGNRSDATQSAPAGYSSSSNPTGHVCPCKPKGETHKWKPTQCRRLETAVRGSSSPPIHLSETRRREILQRLGYREHEKTRRAIEQLKWTSSAPLAITAPTLGQPNGSAPKVEFPGNVQAALIDPKMMQALSDPILEKPGVYNLMDFNAHPLSDSTIFDNGAATHLVNSADRLVPGSFRPSGSTDTVEAGTQAFPVTGRGARLFKNALHGKRGPYTEDLLLQDVVVVEGFHVNIISEARLQEKGVWYLGLDSSLRVGYIEDLNGSVVCATLKRAHNLTFFEYKPLPYYSPILNAVTTKRSYESYPRSSAEHLWHARAGHLGPEALKALVRSARGVQINGTLRKDCEVCATTHAKQVISRRKREKPARPFWRIGWDLFDMPLGRGGELWILLIKEYYSGKLFVYTLQGKTQIEILRVLTNFSRWVLTQYKLSICKISQDNDTATLPWRGSSSYERWAIDEGIDVERVPPYTHEPNGAAERAGQEVITKSIKMRSGANLPEKLWPEVVTAAAWLYNMSPSHANELRSPNEELDRWFTQYFRWYEPERVRVLTADLRPDWSGIFAYGCRAYPLNRERAAGRHRRGFKVTPRGHIGYLVGYRASNIYRIWVPKLNQVITTRNVTFNEELFYNPGDESTAIPVEEAAAVVDFLHEPDEIIDVGDAIELPIAEGDLSLGSPTERQLGGDAREEPRLLDGQSSIEGAPEAETARAASLAGKPLEIRAGRQQEIGLLSPDPTPEPELPSVGGEAPEEENLTGGSREVHSTDREGSVPVDTEDLEDPPRPASPIVLIPSRRATRADEASGRRAYQRRSWGPPTRRSRRILDRERDELADDNGAGQYSVISSIWQHGYLWLIQPLFEHANKFGSQGRELLTVHAVIVASTLRKEKLVTQPERLVHRDELPPLPKKWKDLAHHQLGALFRQACEKEIATLIEKKTWVEVDRSSATARPLPLKWVFTYKLDQNGYFIKCKARICVRGDLQAKDSIISTYATTLASRSFRTIVAIAAQFDLELHQYDVAGAFLNASRQDQPQVLCELPDGFTKPEKVVLLLQALYGLRDSPVLWYKELSTTLRTLGLTASKEEPCLFYDSDRRIVLLFYVDDILLAYHNDDRAAAELLMSSLMSKYRIEDHGAAEWFLGVRIIRDRADRTITLAHDAYIDKLATKFGVVEKGSFPSVPFSAEELLKYDGEASKREVKAFQERVGSILYTAIMIRPDVAYAASQLSHHLTNPGAAHFKAADQVIAYLYRTKHLGIRYGAHNGSQLLICGDASFADDRETRRSSQGYIVQLFGGPIIWKAARQSTVTTSTTEAELLALEHVAKESAALKRFLYELRLDLGVAWEIFCDNQQTIRLVVEESERLTTRLRHVDIQNMWLKQEYSKGNLQVTYMKTSEMPADGLTKALPRQAHERFLAQLNLYNIGHIVRKEEVTGKEHVNGEREDL